MIRLTAFARYEPQRNAFLILRNILYWMQGVVTVECPPTPIK